MCLETVADETFGAYLDAMPVASKFDLYGIVTPFWRNMLGLRHAVMQNRRLVLCGSWQGYVLEGDMWA
jgi:hypothetical protein